MFPPIQEFSHCFYNKRTRARYKIFCGIYYILMYVIYRELTLFFAWSILLVWFVVRINDWCQYFRGFNTSYRWFMLQVAKGVLKIFFTVTKIEVFCCNQLKMMKTHDRCVCIYEMYFCYGSYMWLYFCVEFFFSFLTNILQEHLYLFYSTFASIFYLFGFSKKKM